MNDQFLDAPNIRAILDLPLHAKTYKPIPDSVRATCRTIGLSGWSAWTAADRIRDEEGSCKAHDLVSFSLGMLAMHAQIRALCLDDREYARTEKIIRAMERANAGIMPGIRARSAWKSMGAAIPLLILMMKAGAPATDMHLCERYFYHFILARQLSDDARDRDEDQRKGVLTLATAWLDRPHQRNRLAREILRHAGLAIASAQHISCFKNTAFLEDLPRRYVDMAQHIISSYN